MTEENSTDTGKSEGRKPGRPRAEHFKPYKNLSRVKLHGIKGVIFPGKSGLLSPKEADIFKDKIREA